MAKKKAVPKCGRCDGPVDDETGKCPVCSPVPADGEFVLEMGDLGPVEIVRVPFRPGRATIITGPNGIGKSETLKGLQTLASGENAGLTVRDGCEVGSLEGFGRKAVFKAGRCRITGELGIYLVEEGFSIAQFVDPGSTASDLKARAITNDRRRVSSLASALGIEIPKERVHELVGGAGVYRSVVTPKTTDAKDPAEYVASLKSDLDAAARDREQTATVRLAEAETLRRTLPEVIQGAETDEEVLTEAVAKASNHKKDLLRRIEEADGLKRLAETARQVLAAGQGQTVEAAVAEVTAAAAAVKSCEDTIADFEREIAIERGKLAGLNQNLAAAIGRKEAAQKRTDELADASRRLEEQVVVPTDKDLESAEEAIKLASDAFSLGKALRDAADTKTEIAELEKEAEEKSQSAASLRNAAGSVLDLLVEPINAMQVGIEIESVEDGPMRLVCTEHPRRQRCFLEDLSQGERWRLVIRLIASVYGARSDVPPLFWVPQEAYEGLDCHARKEFVEAIAETNMMVAIACAAQTEEEYEAGISARYLEV